MKQDLSQYQTLEDFQKYIDENNIQSPKDFNKKNCSLYRKTSYCGLSQKLKYPIKREVNKVNDWSEVNSLDDFQNFIINHNIQTSKEFRQKYNTLYQKAIRLDIKNNLRFNDTHFWRDLSQYQTLEDFQKYIDENEILSPLDFKKYDCSLYRKASKLNLCNQLIYEKRNVSLSEITILKFLECNNINYVFQQKFEWLKDRMGLALDFYLPQFNLAIEVQGKQHFVPNIYFGGESRFIEDVKRDELKYKLCTEHNIKIIYFVDLTTDDYFGIDFAVYLDKVFTDTENLLTFLKTLGYEN